MKNIEKIISKFKIKKNLHIRYGDLDTFKHVNNKSYLSFLEDARIYYFEKVINFDLKKLDFETVVARIEISYHYPIKIEDKVIAYIRCCKIGSKSLDLETIIVKNDNKIVAKSKVTLVSFDIKNEKSTKNNLNSVKLIREFEKNSNL